MMFGVVLNVWLFEEELGRCVWIGVLCGFYDDYIVRRGLRGMGGKGRIWLFRRDGGMRIVVGGVGVLVGGFNFVCVVFLGGV